MWMSRILPEANTGDPENAPNVRIYLDVATTIVEATGNTIVTIVASQGADLLGDADQGLSTAMIVDGNVTDDIATAGDVQVAIVLRRTLRNLGV